MKDLILGIILGALAVVVGQMGYQDELEEQQRYCKMVQEGLWGDYDGNYSKICETERAGSALPPQDTPYDELHLSPESEPGDQVSGAVRGLRGL